jgi:hypothetical protein
MPRNTALIIFSYNRPDLTRRRLEQLVGVNCQIIVSIDAPKTGSINADFTDLKIEYSEHVQFIQTKQNLGTAMHLVSMINEQFQTFDNIIVIEDDVAADKTSIDSLVRILENRLPGDVLTIGLFGGLPGKFLSLLGLNYWRQSRYFSAWGWAIQKEDWHLFSLDIEEEIPKLENSKSWQRMNERERVIWKSRFAKVVRTYSFTWDYQMMFAGLLHNKMHLLPLFRCVDNEGFGDIRAVNTKESRPNWYLGSRGTIQNKCEDIRIIPGWLGKGFETLDRLTWAGSSFTLLKLLKAKSNFLRTTRVL